MMQKGQDWKRLTDGTICYHFFVEIMDPCVLLAILVRHVASKILKAPEDTQKYMFYFKYVILL
jgi:hypothetical protein